MSSADQSPPPSAHIERAPRRFSLLWVLPFLALVGVIAVLFYQAGQERGPRIMITFPDAQGLEPGADIIHRGLSVGVVREINLSEDLASAVVIADLAPSAEGIAVEGSQFWIVRPEVSLDRVSGLETILGPRYIAVKPGDPGLGRARVFTGLSESMRRQSSAENEGLMIRINAPSAGSLSIGSAVLYRNIPVGRITGIRLAGTAQHVEIDAVIEERYEPLVRANTRFWDASGVGVDFGIFRGLSVAAGSIDTVLRGAISFATPTKAGLRVGDGHTFELQREVDSDWLEWEPEIAIVQGS